MSGNGLWICDKKLLDQTEPDLTNCKGEHHDLRASRKKVAQIILPLILLAIIVLSYFFVSNFKKHGTSTIILFLVITAIVFTLCVLYVYNIYFKPYKMSSRTGNRDSPDNGIWSHTNWS